jgi:DNA-binding CsgD family transcriptional regulator
MYQDWHGRTAGTRFRLVGQATLGPELQAGVALHRVTSVGRYESRDLERFDLLHGHLKRALTIGARIGTLGTAQQITAECLDRSHAAIIFLDQRGRVVFLNRAAEALRKAGDGIQFFSSGLRLARAADNEAFQSLISAALAAPTNTPTQAAVMRVARPSGKPAYGIHVTRVRPPSVALTLFRPSVCVIITDPARSSGPPALQLQSLFKLTQAEARLAVRLASGESLRTSAAQLGITYGSARSRLMQIFGKTGTRTQSELIRLLLTILLQER